MLLLLRQSGKREAIKFYQEQTGADRRSAKQALRELQQQHPGSKTSSYVDVVMLALVIVSLLLGAWVS